MEREQNQARSLLQESSNRGSRGILTSINGKIVKITSPVGDGYIIQGLGTNILLESSHVNFSEFFKKNVFISDNGVCVRFDIHNPGFDLEEFQIQLRVYIDMIYNNGVYFHGLCRHTFEVALYGSLEEVRSIVDPNDYGILICSTIQQLPESQIKIRDKIYGEGIQIAKDMMSATLIPHTTAYLRAMLGEAYQENEMFILNGDIFHAYLWEQGIRYYGESTFLERVHQQSRDILEDILDELRGIIALGKKSTETRDDIRMDYNVIENIKNRNPALENPFPPLKIRRGPLIVDKKAVPGEMECFFPKALKGHCILEIILGKRGDPGILVSGKPVLCKDVKKVAISSQLDGDHSELIDIDTSDPTRIRVIAKEDIYIGESHSRLGFSRNKKYVGEIGKKTGNINLPKDGTVFELRGDILEGYSVNGYDIVYSGNLYGRIIAQNNVTILSGGILGGHVTAGKDINIEKGVIIHDKTKLEATNGTIMIDGDLNGAIVTADLIIISGTAMNCTLIGRRVEIKTNNGSKVLAESFHINNDRSGIAEYTILVYAGIHGLIHEIAELEKNMDGKSEDEQVKIGRLVEQLDENAILVGGIMHPDSRFQIMAVPFLINTDLGGLMRLNNNPELNRSKKNYGLLHMVLSAQRNEGVLCKISNTGLTRIQAISILEKKLQSRVVINAPQRDPLYRRGIRLPVFLNPLKGYIFDYSDSGCSFILVNNNANDGGSIMVNTTTNFTILGDEAVTFFVTCVENKTIGGVNYIFVAGSYISSGIGAKINKAVSLKETAGKRLQQ